MTGARRTYPSAARRNRRHIQRKRPTAKNQKKQILKNQNQIVAIQRQIKHRREPVKWRCGFTFQTMDAYPFVIPLTSGPTSVLSQQALLNNTAAATCGWSYTMSNFPQSSGDNRSKCYVHKQYVDLAIHSGTESALLNYTAFLVQLKPEVATEVYSATGQMKTLVNDQDYCTAPGVAPNTGYGAFMNSTRYKILGRVELETQSVVDNSISSVGRPTGNTGRGTRTNQIHRQQFRLNYGNTLLKAPAGQGTNADLDDIKYDDISPAHKRFIVIFSNNSSIDGQYPKVSMSSLITGQTL